MHRLIILYVFVCVFIFQNVSAHTTIDIKQYEINIGWEIEPPIEGFINNITFEINEKTSQDIKKGIKNAFKNMTTQIKFGNLSKILNINSDQNLGHYKSTILPTRSGIYNIEMHGSIHETPIDIILQIDEVVNKNIIAFPSLQTINSDKEIIILKNAVSSLQNDLDHINTSYIINTQTAPDDIINVYNFGIFGIVLGISGIILSIFAMIKRNKL